ncbi:hypothetical protein ACS0TY_029904 [Phlomoides rotata]
MTIAPPPPCTCNSLQHPRKSRTLRRQDDPFLAALKTVSNHRAAGYEVLRQQKKYVSAYMEKMTTFSNVFSCKKSCNVESDNLVKFSKLPPIPKERYNAKSFVRN